MLTFDFEEHQQPRFRPKVPKSLAAAPLSTFCSFFFSCLLVEVAKQGSLVDDNGEKFDVYAFTYARR